MKQAVAITIDYTNKRTQTLTWGLLAIATALAGMYVYFVVSATWNAFALEQSKNDIASLNSKLGDMEFQYMSEKNNVTLDVAYSKGFINNSNTSFVTREKMGKSVALRSL